MTISSDSHAALCIRQSSSASLANAKFPLEKKQHEQAERTTASAASRLSRLSRRAKALYAASGSKTEVVRFFRNYAWRKLPLLGAAAMAKLRQRGPWYVSAFPVSQGKPAILFHTQGGGLGDDIVLARFIRDLIAVCGPIEFQVASNNKQRARWVYDSVPGFQGCSSPFVFDEIAPLYTLSVRVSQVIEVAACHETDLRRAYPKLSAIRHNLAEFAETNALLIKGLPYTSGDLARRAVFANATRATFLHHQAGIAYGGDRLAVAVQDGVIERLGLSEGGYVTVHNGFDPAFVVSGHTSSKSYRGFDEVVGKIKAMLPGIRVVQLGTADTSTVIPGVDIPLIAQTTLPEVAALIGKARLHLDVDSGLTHLASAIGTPAVVLFGPSDADYFGYEGNTNLRPKFCGGCWWTNEAWMDRCPRRFDEPRCMTSHAPGEVVAHAAALLQRSSHNPKCLVQ